MLSISCTSQVHHTHITAVFSIKTFAYQNICKSFAKFLSLIHDCCEFLQTVLILNRTHTYIMSHHFSYHITFLLHHITASSCKSQVMTPISHQYHVTSLLYDTKPYLVLTSRTSHAKSPPYHTNITSHHFRITFKSHHIAPTSHHITPISHQHNVTSFSYSITPYPVHIAPISH